MTANARLKEEIVKSPLSNKKLAELANIADRTLYDAFKDGHDFRVSLLYKINEVTEIDISYILTGIRNTASVNANSHYSIQEIEPSILDQPPWEYETEFCKVPFYNVTAHTGNVHLIEDKEPISFSFRRYFIKNTLKSNVSNLFLINITGDSMYPTLSENDLILVDKSRKIIARDAIYLVRMDDMYRVKRVQKLEGQKFRLISDNTIYPPVEVSKENSEIEIIGEITWMARTLNPQ